jgi:hypothetical protein
MAEVLTIGWEPFSLSVSEQNETIFPPLYRLGNTTFLVNQIKTNSKINNGLSFLSFNKFNASINK